MPSDVGRFSHQLCIGDSETGKFQCWINMIRQVWTSAFGIVLLKGPGSKQAQGAGATLVTCANLSVAFFAQRGSTIRKRYEAAPNVKMPSDGHTGRNTHA